MSVTAIEPFLSWEDLGRNLGGFKKRWLEERVAEGMPSYFISNRRAFRLSEAVRWLEENGYIERPA